MPLWLLTNWKAIAVGAAILAIFSAGYELRVKLDEAAHAIELADEAKAQKEAQGKADTKAAAWEKQLADLRAANKKLDRRLHDETQAAVYSKCIVPDAGVQIFNDALSGGSAAGPGR